MLLGSAVGIVLLPVLLFAAGMLANLRTPSPTDLSKSVQLAAPPPALSRPVTLRVVTMNVWDLKQLSTHRAERLPAIGAALARLEPDLIGLQEAFVRKDRAKILAPLRAAGLGYHRYFRSGFVGSGLLVISRYPFEEAFFRRYSKGGKPLRVDHGDWWAGKGACLVRVRLPRGGFVDFFDTHGHAAYREDRYDAVRQSNMEELAAFIREAATGTSPALVVGDFNTSPRERQYKTLVENARLRRLMAVDSRIDHIFAVANPRYEFEVLETRVLDDRIDIDGTPVRLSDHKGYLSVIRITPRRPARPR